MLKFRSTQKELLDAAYIPEQDLFQNLRELDFINHWLGGYRISYSAFRKVLSPGRRYTLVDIGSGGGDTLKRIYRWNQSKGLDLELIGIDIKETCIKYATRHAPVPSIRFVCDDYRNIGHHVAMVDVIHASLFCHHLNENEIVALIRFARDHGAVLVVNDLERSWLAYQSIKWLTRIFSKSHLVKHDAPLSVARGFKRSEWLSMLNRAGVQRFSVRNKWAFRHEVIVYP